MKKTEKDLPKVTIVIPVYNGADYVKFAIDSALNQTYKNIEILVVNDGSTDATEKVVKSYGDKVRYIKKKNGGVSTALNLAIEKMTGEYFSWLSHDDTYEPNKVECEIDYLVKNNYLGKKVIVFSDYNLIDKNGKLIGKGIKDHHELELKPEYGLLKGHINGLSLLIPKKAFDEYGGFDSKLFCTQDYAKWWEMMKTYKFYHIPEILVNTRYHKKQTTHTNPKVLTEGNALYRRIISEIPEKRIIEMEGSRYNFLIELSNFHKNSVYTEFSDECRKEADKIFEEAKGKIAKKKVSVIIPFYNRSKEVKKAIDSVLNQTHKNIEIVLVNDGSTDDFSELYEFIKKEKNITLIENKKNVGVAESRNIGMINAKGDYIAFLDSDDEFVENKIALELQYAEASNANIIHSSYIRDFDGKRDVIHSGENHGHCERELMHSCTIATPTVMIRRKWLAERGTLFNAELDTGEDTCFWLELMKGDTYLVGIGEPLAVVYASANSAAYSDERQAQGLKSIIKYLLNDDYYSKYDFELSQIMGGYVYYEQRINERKTLGVVSDGSVMQKLLFFMKQEGLGSTVKRVGKKIKKTISSKS